MNFKKVLKQSIHDAKHIQVDGLINMLQRRHLIVVTMWIFIMLGSIGIISFLITNTLNQYNMHQVSSTIRYHVERDPVPFPTISFCPVNPFQTEFALQLIEDANVTVGDDDDMNEYWRMFMQIEDYLNKTRSYPMTLEEKQQLTGFWRNFKWYPGFTGAYTDYLSSDNNVQQFFHPRYFNCFVYNINGTVKAMEVKDEVVFYLNPFSNQVNKSKFKGKFQGFYMFIQNISDYLLGEDRPPILLSNAIYHMNLDRQFYNLHPQPYSDCAVREDLELAVELPDRFLFDEVIHVTGGYTQKTCFLFCTQMLTQQLCGCQSNRIAYNMTNSSYCDLRQEMTCATAVANYYHNASIKELFDTKCRANCPLECSMMRFTWNSNFAEEFCGKNCIYLYLYLNDLAYVELDEEPKTTGWDLLGYLGGSFHLLLGMSLVSFIELFELLVVVVLRWLGQNNSKRKLVNDNKSDSLTDKACQIKMNALPNMLRSHSKLIAILWFGIFLSFTSICVYLIHGTVSLYLTYPVATSMSRETNLTTDIAICHPMNNLFHTSYAHDLLTQFNFTSDDPNFKPETAFMKIENGLLQSRGYMMSNDELSRLTSLNRTVISCSVNGAASCEFDFFFDYNRLTHCYSLRMSRGTGSVKGFQVQLILYAGMAANNGDKYFSIYTSSPGAAFMQFLLAYRYARNVVVLQRHSYSQQPWPYSDCAVSDDNTLAVPLDDPSMFELTLHTNHSYTQKLCIDVCKQVLTNRICGCNGKWLSYFVQNNSFCVDTMCANAVFQNATLVESCIRRCPLECSRSIMGVDSQETTLDQSWLLASQPLQHFNFTPADLSSFVMDNVVVVDIHYDSQYYIKISEEPKMEWQDLLGELSGHLHLFLGMSVLSFVEIGELLVFWVIRIAYPRKKDSEKLSETNAPRDAFGTYASFQIVSIIPVAGET